MPRSPALDRGDRLAEPEGHRQVAQVVLQRLDDLEVAELEHPVAPLDHGHLGAERGEHRRVLDADDAGPDDDHRARDPLEVDDPVGVDDAPLVEVDGAGRAGFVPVAITIFSAVTCRSLARPATDDRDRVRVDEAAGPVQQLDVVAGELAADDLDLAADHVLGAGSEVLRR